MLIYSNVKDSTKNKPLTVCTCWNSYLWIDLWHGWLAFWGQNLCSWVNGILGIAANVSVLTQKQIFFPGFTCIYFLLNTTAGKGTQSAAKDYLLSMIKSNLSISYRNRHWQLPKEYLSVPLPCLFLFLWKLQAAQERSKGERNCKWRRERTSESLH